jgi:hypothetical protein
MFTRSGFLFHTFSSKKIWSAAAVTGLCSYHFSEAHKREKKFNARMNELLINKVELSGVFIQERPPFAWLWPINWFLPFHQSLKIILPDGSMLQIGLGHASDSYYSRAVKFVHHVGDRYCALNDMESSIPVEASLHYYREFGRYPKIDAPKLIEILSNTDVHPHKFLELMPNGKRKTCRSEVMDLLHRVDIYQ